MNRLKAVHEALSVLPRELRSALLGRPEREQTEWEEIRIRAGRGLFTAGSSGDERPVCTEDGPVAVSGEALRQTLELATRASLQGLGDKLVSGYLPLQGGHRLGICGRVTLREGRPLAFRELSSLSLRVACSAEDAGAAVFPALMKEGVFQSTLILAPPGVGKTTLLRDLIRRLGLAGIRAGLVDERGEVAALRKGVPQLDIGPLADVLDGCGKGEGLRFLLRTMTPQVLAMDEIASGEDTEALLQGANCGCRLLATAHAASPEELKRRGLYRSVIEGRLFDRLVTISRQGGVRSCRVEELKW